MRDLGTVVQVGMGRLSAEILTGTLVFKQATLVGSRGGSVDDIAANYELMATGRLARRGEVEGRRVGLYGCGLDD